jgi:hypothetical protein
MQSTLELRTSKGTFIDSGIPAAFLDLGQDGIRAFAFAIGQEEASRQITLGNELAGIYVDGTLSRPVNQMKRNIVWEFTNGNNEQLVRAVTEALELCRKLSNEYAFEKTGDMAMSWGVYINGKQSSVDALYDVDTRKDDIRITSKEAYARFLEAGNWTGTKIQIREAKRGDRRMKAGKTFRKHVAVTDTVAATIKRKYKSISASDKWYESNNPFGYNFASKKTGKSSSRWPAIIFNKRKGAF